MWDYYIIQLVTQSYTSAKAKKLHNLVQIIMTQTAGTGSTPPHPSLLKRTERNFSRDLTPVLTLRVTPSQANQQRPLLAHQERLIEGQKNLSASTISHSQPEKGVADSVRPKPGFSIGNRNQDQVLVSVLVADAEIEPFPTPSVSLSSDYFKSRMQKQGSNKTDDCTLLMKQSFISYYSQTEGVADKQSVPRPPFSSSLPEFQDLRLHEETILLEDQKLYSIDAVGSTQIILPARNLRKNLCITYLRFL